MAQYTEQQRIEALAQLELNGGNLKRTAREINLPPATLRLWRDGTERGQPVTVPEKPDLVERFHDVIRLAQQRLMELLPTTESAKDIAVVMGIASDKMLDHRDGRKGGVSVNVDNRSINLPPDLSVDELRRLASGDDE